MDMKFVRLDTTALLSTNTELYIKMVLGTFYAHNHAFLHQ